MKLTCAFEVLRRLFVSRSSLQFVLAFLGSWVGTSCPGAVLLHRSLALRPFAPRQYSFAAVIAEIRILTCGHGDDCIFVRGHRHNFNFIRSDGMQWRLIIEGNECMLVLRLRELVFDVFSTICAIFMDLRRSHASLCVRPVQKPS